MADVSREQGITGVPQHLRKQGTLCWAQEFSHNDQVFSTCWAPSVQHKIFVVLWRNISKIIFSFFSCLSCEEQEAINLKDASKAQSAWEQKSSSVMVALDGSKDFASGDNRGGSDFMRFRYCQAFLALAWMKSLTLIWLLENWLLKWPKCCSKTSSLDLKGNHGWSNFLPQHWITMAPQSSWRLLWVWLAIQMVDFATLRLLLVSMAKSSARSRSRKPVKAFSILTDVVSSGCIAALTTRAPMKFINICPLRLHGTKLLSSSVVKKWPWVIACW